MLLLYITYVPEPKTYIHIYISIYNVCQKLLDSLQVLVRQYIKKYIESIDRFQTKTKTNVFSRYIIFQDNIFKQSVRRLDR